MHFFQNCVAKSKPVVWLAIEKRVFSVELHLYMKGYCWLMLGAKIVTRKKQPWKWTNLQKMNVCQILNWIKSGFSFAQVALAMQFRKIYCLMSEFHVKFHVKNQYRMNCFAMSTTSVFQVKFNVEFTRQAVNFSIIFL